MAIKNWIVDKFKNDRKKSICVIASLVLLCVFSAVLIRYSSKTKASIYRTDKDGNIQRMDEVHVLEIVARNGEQVLGYTVKGQEPISRSDIENYQGPLNLTDAQIKDFRNATGYIISHAGEVQVGDETHYKYKVENNILNGTFNDNVLDSSMNDGEIIVHAIQASSVKISDVDWADLIYINSNDYNNNLLYYYDQFVNNGEAGIPAGEFGATYNQTYVEKGNQFNNALKRIIRSAGFPDRVEDINKIDFDVLSQYTQHGEYMTTDNQPAKLTGYLEENYTLYKDAIGKLPENHFKSEDTIGDTIVKINTILEEINLTQQENAFNTIKEYAGKEELENDETVRELVSRAIINSQMPGVFKQNMDIYLSELRKVTLGATDEIVANIIVEANVESAKEAYKNLKEYKGKVSPELLIKDEDGTERELTTEENNEIVEDLQLIQQGEISEYYKDSYFKRVFADDFQFEDENDAELFAQMISDVNSQLKEKFLNDFAESTDSIENFKAYKLIAYKELEFCNLSDYNVYFYTKYIEELEKRVGDTSKSFKNNDGTGYDLDKIHDFLKEINGVDVFESYEVNGDISWKVALQIYTRVQNEEVGIMYNSQLLTNKVIGDYSTDKSNAPETDKTDNKNNVYKMLLLLRQIRYPYAQEKILPNIDEDGVYYPKGLDNPEGATASWWKETFGNEFNDHKKYIEPDVVGDVYDENNAVLYNTNYVYKRIYSYTGEEFFGGRLFVTGFQGEEIEDHVATANALYHDELNPQEGEGEEYVIFAEANAPVNARFIKSGSDLWIHYFKIKEETRYDYWGRAHTQKTYTDEIVRKGTVQNKEMNLYKFIIKEGYDAYYISNSEGSGGSFKTPTTEIPGGSNAIIRKLKDTENVVYSDIVISRYSTKIKDLDFQYYDMAGALENVYLITKNGVPTTDNRNNTEHMILDYKGTFRTQFLSIADNESKKNGNIKGYYQLEVDGKQIDLGTEDGYKQCNTSISDTVVLNEDGSETLKIDGNEVNLVTTSGEKVSLGIGSILKIRYKTVSKGYNETSELISDYYFRQIIDSEIKITNFPKKPNENPDVEFYGSAELKFDYDDMDYVRYTINNVEYSIASGDTIVIGADNPEESSFDFSVTYKFKSESQPRTVSARYHKLKTNKHGLNYLSTETATNNSAIPRNQLPSDFSQYPNDITKGNIVKYLLNVNTDSIQNLPIRILEIQPSANTSEFGTFGNSAEQIKGMKTILSYINVDTSDAGIKKLFKQANLGTSNGDLNNVNNYKKIVKIQSMSVREFNTRENDLAADYDIIYIGAQEGNLFQSHIIDGGVDVWRTSYTDETMNGMVYTGIGDIVEIRDFMAGVAASDYREAQWFNNDNQKNDLQNWKKYYFDGFTNNTIASWNLDKNKDYIIREEATGEFYTRHIGRDITVDRMEELLDFAKSGYAILLDDKVMYCDDDSKYVDKASSGNSQADKWRYVDKNSKMYHFVVELKNLGYDAASGTYTGKTTNSDGSVVNTFTDGKKYPSVVAKSLASDGKNPEFLPDNQKLQGGLRYAYNRVGRVQFNLSKTPKQYDKGVSDNTIGNMIEINDDDYKNYSFTLDVTTSVDKKWLEQNYEYKVYVDKSGIGKFNADVSFTLTPEVTYSEDGKQVTLSGEWPGEMYGFIPWKVEAYNKSNPNLKFSEIGFSAFQYPEEKKQDVYVLWLLSPKTASRQNLSSDSKVELNLSGLIRKYSSQIENAGYRVHVLPISYKSFSDYYGGNKVATTVYDEDNTKLKIKSFYKAYYDNRYSETTVLNISSNEEVLKFNQAAIKYLTYQFGNNNYEYDSKFYNDMPEDKLFDMIVFGFKDSPIGGDITSVEAMNDITWFTTVAGKSLLFSHDGDSYTTTINNYKNTRGGIYDGDWDWGKHVTSALRTIIGQDVYGIMKNDVDVNANENNENYNDSRRYIEGADQWWYRGYTENFTMNYSRHEWKWFYNNIYSKTRGQMDRLKTDKNANTHNWPQTTSSVIKLNKGQITQYPFVMGDTLNVSRTHVQYLALNLEDEDTTVWYTLDGNGTYYGDYGRGDGSNNYYIYTNGNVTYSGAGHTPSNERDNLLFINTIVFAIKAGNFSPTVDLLNARKVTENNVTENYVDCYEIGGATVSFRASDIDSVDDSKPFKVCQIYIDRNGDGKYTEGQDVLLNDPNNPLISNANGQPYALKGPDMVNKTAQTFYINNDNLNAINGIVGNIYDYKIYIRVQDQNNGYGQNSFKLNFKAGANERKFFNLN